MFVYAFLIDSIPMLFLDSMAEKRIEEVMTVALMEWIEIFIW